MFFILIGGFLPSCTMIHQYFSSFFYCVSKKMSLGQNKCDKDDSKIKDVLFHRVHYFSFGLVVYSMLPITQTQTQTQIQTQTHIYLYCYLFHFFLIFSHFNLKLLEQSFQPQILYAPCRYIWMFLQERDSVRKKG